MTQPAPADVDRARANMQAIINALLPQLVFYGHYRYRVVSASAGPPVTISARYDDVIPNLLPDLVSVTLRPDSTGGRATPQAGASILIGFEAADPERYYVHSLDPDSIPSAAYIDAITLVQLGDANATFLAHASEVSTSFTQIITLLGALSTYVVAIQPIADPLNNATPVLTAAITAAINAITTQLATLSTTIVKGT